MPHAPGSPPTPPASVPAVPERPLPEPPGAARRRFGWIALAALAAAYLVAFCLPVFDNGSLNHMDIRPQGRVLGGAAFLRSGALLLNLAAGSPLAAGLGNPELPYVWLAAAWLANPLFWIGLGLLAWRKNKLTVVVAAVAVLLAWNARIALRTDAVVVAQRFQSGYGLWLACMVALAAVGLWRAARGPVERRRGRFATSAIAMSCGLLLALVVTVGHFGSAFALVAAASSKPLTDAEYASRMRSSDPQQRRSTLERRVQGAARLRFGPPQTGTAPDDPQSRQTRQARVMSDLLAAADDPAPEVRRTALLHLYIPPFPGTDSEPPAAEMLAVLRPRLDDPDAEARVYAAGAILKRTRERADWQAGPDMTDAAWKTVADVLRDGGAEARGTALNVAGEGGEAAEPAIPGVVGCLKAPNFEVRVTAIRTLRALRPPGTPEILDCLDDPNPKVARAALETAEKMGPAARTHVVVLGRIFRKDSDLDRWAAKRVLMEIGAPAVPELVKAFGSEDDSIRSSAALTLGEMGAVAAPALPALMRLEKNDPVLSVKGNAEIGIEKILMSQKGITEHYRAGQPKLPRPGE